MSRASIALADIESQGANMRPRGAPSRPRRSRLKLAARVTERQPITLRADRKRAIIAVRDAAPLADFREALRLGRQVICGNCSRFRCE